MEKCLNCGGKDLVKGSANMSITVFNADDFKYFVGAEAFACKDCGYIHIKKQIK